MSTNPERSLEDQKPQPALAAELLSDTAPDSIVLSRKDTADPVPNYTRIEDVPVPMQQRIMAALYDTLAKGGSLELSSLAVRLKGLKLGPLRSLLGLKGEKGTFGHQLIEAGVARQEDGKLVLLSTLVNNPPATYEEAVSLISAVDQGEGEAAGEKTITELVAKSAIGMPEPSAKITIGTAPEYKREEPPKLKRGETVEEMEARKEAWMKEFFGTIARTGTRKKVHGGVRLFTEGDEAEAEIEEGGEEDGTKKNASIDSKGRGAKAKKREDYKVFLRELKAQLEKSKGGGSKMRKKSVRASSASDKSSSGEGKVPADNAEFLKKQNERVEELAAIPIEKRTLEECIELIRLGQEKIAQTYNQIQSTGSVNTAERNAYLLIMMLEANEELIAEMKKMYDVLLPIDAPINEVLAKQLRQSVFVAEEQALKWLVKESNQALRRPLSSEVKMALNKALESAEVVDKGFREVFSRMYPESIMYQRAKSELPEYLFTDPKQQKPSEKSGSLAMMVAEKGGLATSSAETEQSYTLQLQKMRAFVETNTDLSKLSADDRVVLLGNLKLLSEQVKALRGTKDPMGRRLTILVKVMQNGSVPQMSELAPVIAGLE
jgi:hypothetical protein